MCFCKFGARDWWMTLGLIRARGRRLCMLYILTARWRRYKGWNWICIRSASKGGIPYSVGMGYVYYELCSNQSSLSVLCASLCFSPSWLFEAIRTVRKETSTKVTMHPSILSTYEHNPPQGTFFRSDINSLQSTFFCSGLSENLPRGTFFRSVVCENLPQGTLF